MGQIGKRQLLVFSERGQLSQAIPQVHLERVLHQRTPIARFESQHNERRVYEPNSVFLGGSSDRQRTLVIWIAAIILASDSAITLARFRPSKNSNNEGRKCRQTCWTNQWRWERGHPRSVNRTSFVTWWGLFRSKVLHSSERFQGMVQATLGKFNAPRSRLGFHKSRPRRHLDSAGLHLPRAHLVGVASWLSLNFSVAFCKLFQSLPTPRKLVGDPFLALTVNSEEGDIWQKSAWILRFGARKRVPQIPVNFRPLFAEWNSFFIPALFCQGVALTNYDNLC